MPRDLQRIVFVFIPKFQPGSTSMHTVIMLVSFAAIRVPAGGLVRRGEARVAGASGGRGGAAASAAAGAATA